MRNTSQGCARVQVCAHADAHAALTCWASENCLRSSVQYDCRLEARPDLGQLRPNPPHLHESWLHLIQHRANIGTSRPNVVESVPKLGKKQLFGANLVQTASLGRSWPNSTKIPYPKSGQILPKSRRFGRVWAECVQIRAKVAGNRHESVEYGPQVGQKQGPRRDSGRSRPTLSQTESKLAKIWAKLGRTDQAQVDFAHELATRLGTHPHMWACVHTWPLHLCTQASACAHGCVR